MTSGPLSDRVGRKSVVMIAAVIFILGSFAAAWAQSLTILITARLILGLAVGATSQIVPVYIAELAPANRRGALVVLFQLAVVSGILISSIVGWRLGASGAWRLMFLIGVAPAVILLIGMIPLPESPRFQSLNGKPRGRGRRFCGCGRAPRRSTANSPPLGRRCGRSAAGTPSSCRGSVQPS